LDDSGRKGRYEQKKKIGKANEKKTKDEELNGQRKGAEGIPRPHAGQIQPETGRISDLT